MESLLSEVDRSRGRHDQCSWSVCRWKTQDLFVAIRKRIDELLLQLAFANKHRNDDPQPADRGRARGYRGCARAYARVLTRVLVREDSPPLTNHSVFVSKRLPP